MITTFSNLKLLEAEASWNTRLDWNTIALYQKFAFLWWEFWVFRNIWSCHIVNIFFNILKENFIYSRGWNTNKKLLFHEAGVPLTE